MANNLFLYQDTRGIFHNREVYVRRPPRISVALLQQITHTVTVTPTEATIAVATEAPALLRDNELSPTEATITVATEAPTLSLLVRREISPASEATITISTAAPTLDNIVERTISPASEATITVKVGAPSLPGIAQPKQWPVMISYARHWTYENEAYGKDVVYRRRYTIPLLAAPRVAAAAEATITIETEAPTIVTVGGTAISVTPAAAASIALLTDAPGLIKTNPTNSLILTKRSIARVVRGDFRLSRAIPIPLTDTLVYDHVNFSVFPSGPGDYQFQSWPALTDLWSDHTAPWVENVSGVHLIFLWPIDADGVDRSAQLDLINAGDQFMWYESAGRWIRFNITQSQYSAPVYAINVQLLSFDETDGTGNIDESDGARIEFRAVRSTSPVFARRERVIPYDRVEVRRINKTQPYDVFATGQRIISPSAATITVETEAPDVRFEGIHSPTEATIIVRTQAPNILLDDVSPLSTEIVVMHASRVRRRRAVLEATRRHVTEMPTRILSVMAKSGSEKAVSPGVATITVETEAPTVSIINALTAEPTAATIAVATESPEIDAIAENSPASEATIAVVTEAPTVSISTNLLIITPAAAANIAIDTDPPGLAGINTIIFPGGGGIDATEILVKTAAPVVKITRWTKEAKPVDNWTSETAASDSWSKEPRAANDWHKV